MLEVVILGSGNVGNHLVQRFEKSTDVNVIQWYNRNLPNINSFPKSIIKTNNINNLLEADIYIIAVNDDKIREVSSKLKFNNRLICHTSGSKNLKELSSKNRRAVFYPLQTISKSSDINNIKTPFCIECENKDDTKILEKLCNSIDSKFYNINSKQREKLHLAAVFVNNFTNQMYSIAKEITDENNIDFDILKPLILETANKINNLDPKSVQTGPAIRGDFETIKKHINNLTDIKHKSVYKILSSLINKDYEKL